jgi:phosphoribosyl-ATP pyrophosphohydrolase
LVKAGCPRLLLQIIETSLNEKNVECALELLKIISNSNIKHLNLFKNELNNFDDCMNIVFRTKLVQKKNEIKKDEINKDYIIDKNSTLMTLDLSNNAFYSLNDNYIYLIKNLIEDNSTIGCLDLSHIFFGPYPDKSMKPKTTKYRNAIEKDLADTLMKRKKKFSDLSYKKRLKEIGLEDYKNKKGEEKLNFTTETINNEIKKIIQKPDDLNYDSYSNKNQDLYLKDQSSKIYEILKELKKNNVNNEDLKIFAGLTLEDLNSPQIKDDFVNKIVDYIKYKRDKEELTKYNHDLNDKNLILI